MTKERMNRKNFIFVFITGFVVANLLLVISYFIDQINTPLGSVVVSLIGIVLILLAVYLAVVWILATIKRLHDFDVTGWLAIIFFVTPALIILAFIPGTKGPNQFGEKPSRGLDLRSVFLWRR